MRNRDAPVEIGEDQAGKRHRVIFPADALDRIGPQPSPTSAPSAAPVSPVLSPGSGPVTSKPISGPVPRWVTRGEKLARP